MIEAEPGAPVLLLVILEAGTTGKFPQAAIRDSSGVLVSTIDIDIDNGDGTYQEVVLAAITEDDYSIAYSVFDDVARTIPTSTVPRVKGETLRVRVNLLDQNVNDHADAETVGEALVMAGQVHVRSELTGVVSIGGLKRPTDGVTTFHRTAADALTGASPIVTKTMDATHIDAQEWDVQRNRRTS